jgi:hypothetical protein
MYLHAFHECVDDILPRMLKVIKTKNWKLYWGSFVLPAGAEAIGLVTPDKRPTGVLIRLADGKYAQGNAGELRSLSQRSVEKALAAAEAAETLARTKAKSNPGARRPRSLRP